MTTAKSNNPIPSGFDTGLDWSSDDMNTDEKERIIKWYFDVHGDGTNFVPFLVQNAPAPLKWYRRHVAAIASDNESLPQPCLEFLFLHLYSVIANQKGILYEMMPLRERGATKDEIMATLGFAFLESGPRGMNAVTESAGEYLRDWQGNIESSDIRWPDGWRNDPAAFKSGIDHGTDDLTPAELEALVTWHDRVGAGDPRAIRMIALSHPRAYKTQRIRFERAVTGPLPSQMFALFMVHLAAVRGRARALRSAVNIAHAVGVSRRHAVEAIWWASLYGGQTLLYELASDFPDMLAKWDQLS